MTDSPSSKTVSIDGDRLRTLARLAKVNPNGLTSIDSYDLLEILRLAVVGMDAEAGQMPAVETNGITERDKLVAALNRLCPHRGDMPPGMYEEPCPRCLSEEPRETSEAPDINDIFRAGVTQAKYRMHYKDALTRILASDRMISHEIAQTALDMSPEEPAEPRIKPGDRVQNEVGHTGVVMTVGDTRACVQYDDGNAREPLLTNLRPLKASERCPATRQYVSGGRIVPCTLPAGHEGKHLAPEPFSENGDGDV